MATAAPTIDFATSMTGRGWRWRRGAADVDLAPDDLVTQLLLARGCTREALAATRAPTIRGFMPDPSIFCAASGVQTIGTEAGGK